MVHVRDDGDIAKTLAQNCFPFPVRGSRVQSRRRGSKQILSVYNTRGAFRISWGRHDMTSLGVTAAFLCVLLSVKLAIGQQSSGKDAQESARGTVVQSTNAGCPPPGTDPGRKAPFDPCKYSRLGPGIHAARPLSPVDPDYSEPARNENNGNGCGRRRSQREG